MNSDRLEALGFVSWPFVAVPDDFNTTFSCDREWLVDCVSQLLMSYSLRDSSIVNLIWSGIGAGKTHTLLNLRHRAEALGFTSCIYFEMPNRSASFVDVTKALVAAIGADAVLALFGGSPTCFSAAPILEQVCRAAYMGRNTEPAARAWLSGVATASDCRLLDVPRELAADQAVAIVSALVIAMRTGHPARTLILIDEFQRVADRSAAASSSIQASLCTLINRVPKHMSLILSFQASPSDKLPRWFDPSLSSRAGYSHFIPITALTAADARLFLSELVARYRDPLKQGIPQPFTKEVIAKIVGMWGSEKILPRDLIMIASHVFERYLESAAFPGAMPLDMVKRQL